MSYQEENNKVLNSFFERTFFKGWKDPNNEKYGNFNGVEIIWKYWCDLGCKYCYVNRYGKELYPKSDTTTDEVMLDNLKIFLDWMREKGYKPRIDFFSGEPLVQASAFKALKMIVDFLGEDIPEGTNTMRQGGGLIIIPTNYTWILSKELTKQIEELIEYGKSKRVEIGLSASVDGKLMDSNRPYKYTIESMKNDHGIVSWDYKDGFPDPRDDEYYNKVFSYARKYQYGFHPMIYSEKIELWKDNFLWFQDMFRKYDIPWHNLYLLEVRNPEWTNEQIIEFGKFIEFLIEWAWIKCDKNFNQYMSFLLRGKGFNILNNPLSTLGRGLGCGYQSMIYVRMADLSIVTCHRTSYDPYVTGRFVVENKKIKEINVNNLEYYIAGISLDADTFPYCEACMMKKLCTHGCLGAQMETTGDPFTPIPTVCALEHEKVWAMIRAYKRIGIYEGIKRILPKDKIEAFKYMESLL